MTNKLENFNAGDRVKVTLIGTVHRSSMGEKLVTIPNGGILLGALAHDTVTVEPVPREIQVGDQFCTRGDKNKKPLFQITYLYTSQGKERMCMYKALGDVSVVGESAAYISVFHNSYDWVK